MALHTYDYEAEQAALARQYKIAEAMQEQAMQPMGDTPMVGQVAIQRSPLEMITKIVQAYTGAQGQRNADAKRRELGERYRTELKTGVEKLVNGLSTQPTDADGMGPPMAPEMVQGAKHRAVLEAMGSAHPQLQAIGAAQFKTLQDGKLTPKDLAGYATPASVLQNPGNPAGWAPKITLRGVQPGEVTVDDGGVLTPPKVPAQAPANMPFGVGAPLPNGWKMEGAQDGIEYLRDPGGDLYQRTASGLKKMDNAPKTTVTNNVHAAPIPAGEKEFFKKLGEADAKRVDEVRTKKVEGEKALTMATQLEKLNNEGVFSGPTANLAVTMGAFADTLGVPVDKAKLGRSEEYTGVLSKEIARYLTTGSVGRSLTDADRKAIETSFPQMISTPEGRARLIGLIRFGAKQDMDYAAATEKDLVSRYPEAANFFGKSPAASQSYTQPPANPPGQPGDRLKQFKVIR